MSGRICAGNNVRIQSVSPGGTTTKPTPLCLALTAAVFYVTAEERRSIRRTQCENELFSAPVATTT